MWAKKRHEQSIYWSIHCQVFIKSAIVIWLASLQMWFNSILSLICFSCSHSQQRQQQQRRQRQRSDQTPSDKNENVKRETENAPRQAANVCLGFWWMEIECAYSGDRLAFVLIRFWIENRCSVRECMVNIQWI